MHSPPLVLLRPPPRYRTQLCNDGVNCKRKICFFAHTLEELRVSSVKVPPGNNAGCDVGEPYDVNPFAPSSSTGAQAHGGKGHQTNSKWPPGARSGCGPGARCDTLGQPANFSMADLQQLVQVGGTQTVVDAPFETLVFVDACAWAHGCPARMEPAHIYVIRLYEQGGRA